MKSLLIITISIVTVLSSCSVYRSGQTPDDVYYSPGASKQQAAYVEANGDRDDGRRYNDRTYNGYDDLSSADDRWLRMRVRDRYRWSYFDDYNYYNPYNSFGYNGWGGYGSYGFGYQPGFSFGMGFGSFYDPWGSPFYNRFNDYYNWNSYYNPYYPKVIVVNPKNDPAGYNRIRNFNLNSYSNRSYNNPRSVNPRINNRNTQGYNNNNSTLGNSFRRVFSNSNINNNSPRPSRSNSEYYRPSQQDRPTRTYTPQNNNSNNSGYSPRNSGSNSNSSGSSGGSRPNRR